MYAVCRVCNWEPGHYLLRNSEPKPCLPVKPDGHEFSFWLLVPWFNNFKVLSCCGSGVIEIFRLDIPESYYNIVPIAHQIINVYFNVPEIVVI